MSQALDGMISDLNALTQSGDDNFEYDEGEGEEENEDEDEDEDERDAEAEAEEIARRLKDELTAEIAKAQAEQAAAAAVACRPPPPTLAPSTVISMSPLLKKETAVITTMKSVLAYASKDPLVSFTLASASVIDTTGSKSNVLQLLHRSVEVGFIPKELAKPLSQVIVSLAKSETLFASLKNSNAPAALLDKGKRKRDEGDLPQSSKRYASGYTSAYGINEHDLLGQIKPAVHAITQSLSAASLAEAPSLPTSVPSPLDPALISSLQVPLHQVFLFAITTAPSSPQNGALQEIGGLIQMLGVLSGINIGPTQPPHSQHFPHPRFTQSDPSTAVYPCLLPSCQKTFSRLYSLRSHQRSHSSHPSARPYRCLQCPASFARNHDLKRHLKLHGSKAFKCSGCGKVFSRRDAIKRHMNSSRIKSGVSLSVGATAVVAGTGFGKREEAERCRDAEVIEVDVEKEENEEGTKEEKRAKTWGEKLAAAANSDPHDEPLPDQSLSEEGEIPSSLIAEAQNLVLGLFHLLSGYVTKYAPQSPISAEVAGGQLTRNSKTMASVMGSQNWFQLEHSRDVTEPVAPTSSSSSLSLSWLSPEQTKQLEEAIAAAAKAAQEQAEAEAALEEEEEEADGQPSGEGDAA